MNLFLPICILLSAPPPDSLPYDLANPSHVINLVSEDLREISGLSPTDVDEQYLAIADEKGEIFFVDGAAGGAITRRVLFKNKGDFEGVEMVGPCLFAVKSNGDVYEIGRWKRRTPSVRTYETGLTKDDDVEGLGFDARRNALLIACKGNTDSSYARKVYAFDLSTKRLSEQPVYTVDPLEVNRLVPHHPEEKHNFFSPSGIAVHPLTGDVYVLSSAQKRLVVLDHETGAIKMAVRLDKKMLPQPEGISFDSNGDLVLSSEGKQGEGLIMRFRYQGEAGNRSEK